MLYLKSMNSIRTHKKTTGFTIIEVIIALVIVATIMIAVFLVVPQLQMESRNNQRRIVARQTVEAIRQNLANGMTVAEATSVTNMRNIVGTASFSRWFKFTTTSRLSSGVNPNKDTLYAPPNTNTVCNSSNTGFADGRGVSIVTALEPFNSVTGTGTGYCLSTY